MKVKKFLIIFLTIFFIAGMFFSGCNEEAVNAEISPMVDNNMNYLVSQTLNDVFLDFGESKVEGNLFWKDGETTLIKGENEYEWVFEPKNSKKYLGATGVVSVVAYEPLENLNVSVEDWTFGEEAKTPVVENNSGNGEVVFEYAVLGDEFYFKKEPTDAGNYILKTTVQTTSDYARKEVVSAFSIEKKSLQEDMVEDIPNEVYTGNSLKPEVTIEGLSSEENYVVSYEYKKNEGEEFGELVDDFVSAGIYKVKICGKGNYTNEVEKTFQIFEAQEEYQKYIDANTSKPAEEPAKEPAKEPAEETAKNVEEKTAENVDEKTAENVDEKTAENVDEKTAKNVDEKTAENVETKETAENVEEKTAEIAETKETAENVNEISEKEENKNNIVDENVKAIDESEKVAEQTSKTESVNKLENAEKVDEKATETETTNADEKATENETTNADEKATENETKNVDEKETENDLINADDKLAQNKEKLEENVENEKSSVAKDVSLNDSDEKTILENSTKDVKNKIEKTNENIKNNLENTNEKAKSDLEHSIENNEKKKEELNSQAENESQKITKMEDVDLEKVTEIKN
ncbi:MAG: hypothetical protein EOM55_00190 [Clostridia bacterium]|nr:hypothetical protein [Clostridia bacterium]